MSLHYTSPAQSGMVPPTVTVVRHYSTGTGAFLTVIFPGGLQIDSIWITTTTESPRRVSLPSRTYQTRDGRKAYASILEFTTPEAHAEFERQIVAAFNRYLGTSPSQSVGTQEAQSAH